jgi:hypothetical protein
MPEICVRAERRAALNRSGGFPYSNRIGPSGNPDPSVKHHI